MLVGVRSTNLWASQWSSPMFSCYVLQRQCRQRRRVCAALLMTWFSLPKVMDGRGFGHRVLPTERYVGAADGICRNCLYKCVGPRISICAGGDESRKAESAAASICTKRSEVQYSCEYINGGLHQIDLAMRELQRFASRRRASHKQSVPYLKRCTVT